MKKLLLFSAIAMLACSGVAFGQTTASVKAKPATQAKPAAQAQPAAPENPLDKKLKFDKKTIDFGTAKLNKPVTVEFVFTNISDQPVIIQSAQPSCGCTTPEWTKEPVLPGKKGKVKATYNAAALGPVTKTVFVNFKGIQGTMELYLKGKVEQ